MVSNRNESGELLKLLIARGESYSIRRLSQMRKINYKSAYNAMLKLEKEGAVLIERSGNTNRCTFSGKFGRSVFLAEDERRTKLLEDKNLFVAYRKLSQLPFPLIILVFGSQAKGTAARHSDIDLLAITDRGKEVEEVISTIPLNLHLTVVKPDEFSSMAKSREFNVVAEAIKGNIVIIGIEEYYRLLQNARG